MRVIVDTNVWLSYLMGSSLNGLMEILRMPYIENIVTSKLVSEVIEVASREKFRRYFDYREVEQLKHWFDAMTNVSLPADIPHRCRDAKDDYLLELAIRAKAVYLVSGDDDLLEFKEIEGCRIMSVRQFVDEISHSNLSIS